jgi:hypothetical protein
VFCRTLQDRYLDEAGHLLRRIGTLNANTEDAEGFTTCDTGTETRDLRTHLGTERMQRYSLLETLKK